MTQQAITTYEALDTCDWTDYTVTILGSRVDE